MSVAIAVMAKAPAAGRSKTRLMPLLSAYEAAAMGGAFLRDVTANLALAARDGLIVPYVAYAPAGTQDAVRHYIADGTGLLLADGAGVAEAGVHGFGSCLLQAIATMLAQGHQAACVLNADSPNLPTGFLRQAAAYLAAPGDRVVMGPAEDGGYYLLGMKQAHTTLFADIDWSTDRVAAQTRSRAIEAGVTMEELLPWYDVDEPETLLRLRDELAGNRMQGQFAAPHSAACLAQLDMDARLAPKPHGDAPAQHRAAAAP